MSAFFNDPGPEYFRDSEDYDDWDGEPEEVTAHCPHDWEEIWDDGVGQRCCFCMICGEYTIFEYETEDES